MQADSTSDSDSEVSPQTGKDLVPTFSYCQGYCHGDVRIPNIILHEERVVLIDWGLAIEVNTTIDGMYGVADFASDNILSAYCRGTKTSYSEKDDLESLIHVAWSLVVSLV